MTATQAIVLAGLLAFAAAGQAKGTYSPPKYHAPKASTVTVKGHSTKSGAYVMPHVRTAPNSTKRDNYSTVGNVNPYTGKPGNRACYVYPESCE